jgi:tetratricopeptide (TPR) repeat protein
VAAPSTTPTTASGKDKAPKPESKPAQSTSLLGGASSDAPYVLFALRPKLPRSAEQLERAFVLVVDASRSMVGERYRRASELAVRVIEELDPLDRFTLLACDSNCRQLGGGLRFPGKQSAEEVKRFLAAVTPEGASDLVTSMRAARTAAGDTEGRALRVVYIGDGTPTVGPIRPRYLERAVRDALPQGQASVTAVAIGTDADLDALGSMARAGGGTVLPYVPGQRLGEAAYAILGASYGTGLRDVKVELPSGLVEVAPEKLDTIPPGGEALVTARMTSPTLEGTMVVRGKVGTKDYEQRYPIKLAATSAAGNAFVPRMYAALRIGDLERLGSADARSNAVDLSQRFNVASRYTSLLVLESAAMFKAFGLDNTRLAPAWTGEEQLESAKAKGEVAMEGEEADDKKDMGSGLYGRGDSSGGAVGGAARAKAARSFDDFGPPADAAAESQAAPPMPRPAATGTSPAKAGPPATMAREQAPAPRRRGNMIAMRKIWERVGSVLTAQQVPAAANATKLAEAEQVVRDNENRREAVKKLFGLRLLAGQIDGAHELAERWSQKEALDPDALVARADAAASAGKRDEAIRILGSVVDARPGDVPAQQRLARLHRWAGRAAVGCRHSEALAQLRERDAKLLAEAVYCARQTGEGVMAEDMLGAADSETRAKAETELGKMKPPEDKLRGDLQLEASWQGGNSDLDLALLGPAGQRVSWLGAPGKGQLSAVDVTSLSHEGLGLLGSDAGDWVIELTRVSGEGLASGTLSVNAAGTRQQIPFTFSPGERRKTLGIANIRWQSRLVPL